MAEGKLKISKSDKLTVHNFPKMKNTLILDAIAGKKQDEIPVWLLRQAGPYLPEFREMRKYHRFQDICQRIDLACQATLTPVWKFKFDAAIFFNDIMIVPEALGMEFEIVANPVFPEPLTLENFDYLLKPEGAASRLAYSGDVITLVRHQLKGEAVLFGFAGAPWTLMSLMIEGGMSNNYTKAMKWLYRHKKSAQKLIDILTELTCDFCVIQALAGAQVIQIFDTNSNYLNRDLYNEFFMEPLRIIRHRVKVALKEANHEEIPMIIYARGVYHDYDEFVRMGYDSIGLDTQTDPSLVRAGSLCNNICLQGNLDTCALYAPEQDLRDMVNKMIKKFEGSNLIVNLGTGLIPDVPVDNVYVLVDAVKKYKKTSTSKDSSKGTKH